jgi:putative SOS response-associated peptidase YedK
MCIAVYPSINFTSPSVRWKKKPIPSCYAKVTDNLPVLIYNQDIWFGGATKWGASIIIDDRKKRLQHAKVESIEKHFWAQWKPLVIPAKAFIERDTENNSKDFFRCSSNDTFFITGLWKRQPNGDAAFVVVTEPSQQPVASIHHRSPVCLFEEDLLEWVCYKKLAENRMSFHIEQVSQF